MIPIVFINCTEYPYVDSIMAGFKTCETRNRNTLGELVGKRVLIAETGYFRKKPLIKGTAVIGQPVRITSAETWYALAPLHRVPYSSHFEWNKDTKQKYIYPLTDVHEVEPFVPPEWKRHGRVWMEYSEDC